MNHDHGATYAIPDTHGCLPQLRAALELIDLEADPTAQVIFLGDYIDRGPDSLGVLNTVRETCERLGPRAVALLGNHEVDFLDWLDGDEDDTAWLAADTDLTTLRSFLDEQELQALFADADLSSFDGLVTANLAVRAALNSGHHGLFKWLRGLALHYETEDQIFVHAGVDEDAGEWWRHGTSSLTFTHKYPPTTGPFHKTIVAGHVGTPNFHGDGSNGVYFDGQSHYYLDGCVESTGCLNILKFTVATGQYEALSVGERIAEGQRRVTGPACRYGYTQAQVEAIVGSYRADQWTEFHAGQTETVCEGCECGGIHGAVVLVSDAQRFLRGENFLD